MAPETNKDPVPTCVVLADGNLPLTINFHTPDGRIYSFPYAHLIYSLYEKNPDASVQPNAPPDRLVMWFSTHDIVVVGWRLSSLPNAIQAGRIVRLEAINARYFGLSKDAFISAIIIKSQKQTEE